MEDDARLIDLETRISYQDESLRVLSDTVARQQKEIDQIRAYCQQLLERLKAQPESAGEEFSAADEVPPHY